MTEAVGGLRSHWLRREPVRTLGELGRVLLPRADEAMPAAWRAAVAASGALALVLAAPLYAGLLLLAGRRRAAVTLALVLVVLPLACATAKVIPA